MGPLSLCAATIVSLSVAAAPQTASAPDADSLNKLLDAIAVVESHNDPAAIGDSGRAAGVYQIHRSYWADATKILGVNWPYREARDPGKARQVVRAYLCHYGRGKTLLDMARIHNGGPRGHCRVATRAYARKIEQALEKDEDHPRDG